MTRRLRALASLVKLREREKQAAKTGLIAMRRLECEATASVAYATETLALERQIASEGNATMEDFRAWFPAGLERLATAEEAERAAMVQTERAKDVALQAALECKATETLFRRREKERNDSHVRREQAELDELSLRARQFRGLRV